MWQWIHKWGSPKWFYGTAERLTPWFAFSAILLLVCGSIWGLAFAPVDYYQGNSYRIIFIHVPSAFLAQSIYLFMAVAALVSLVWHIKLADVFIKSVAPVGAWITFLALLTGAVWGKPTWGTWWVWDARLTSMLVLLFLYFGVMALQGAFENRESAARAVAVLVLVGVVNIPIIKYSVDWWNTLHQPASLTLTDRPAMPADMYIPLLTMILAFYLFFGWTAFRRMQNEILERESRTRWVRDLAK